MKELPFRFRYMEPLYLSVQKQLYESLCVNPEIWMPDAFCQLQDLYYEHLDLVAGSAFWQFFQTVEPEPVHQCTLEQYAGYWKQLLLKAPILNKVINTWNRDFIKHISLLQKRVEKDWPALMNLLGQKAGKIALIDSGVSDVHNGKCVHIITFEDGNKIVYKPRSLRLDHIWQEYLQDMAEKSGIDPFPAPWILLRKNYGYEEFVKRKAVTGENGFSEYFYRCGFLLGIAYVLQGSDFHGENLIASGNYPVLIDLETGIRACANSIFSDVKNLAEERYAHDSVLKTNLLPFLITGRNLIPGEDAFTSQKSSLQNLPYDQKGLRSGRAYAKEIIAGFKLAYDTIMKYGITDKFTMCKPRFLIRSTTFYVNFIRWLYSYDSIMDKKIFHQRLDFLSQLYGTYENDLFFKSILSCEKRELLMGYIPRLTLKMNTPWNGNTQKTLGDILLEKADNLSDTDKRCQCQRIAISLNYKIPVDRLYLKCRQLWKKGKNVLEEIEAIMHQRISFWNEKLKTEAPEGIVVSKKDGRYYLITLPWNMMEGIPGLLPALAAWYGISGSSDSLALFSLIAEKFYKVLADTNLKLYHPGLSEGLEGILCMVCLVRDFLPSVLIDQIEELILPVLKTRDEKELSLKENYNFESGLLGGMDGVAFPSFFKGEGGWLYTLLKKSFPSQVPSVSEKLTKYF